MKKIVILIAFIVFTSSVILQAQDKKVLFVLSAEDSLPLNKGEKKRQTGVFLNEFHLAYQAIVSNGYQVDFATPKGIKATIDRESIKNEYWEENHALQQEAIEFWETNTEFSSPLTLEEALNQSEEYMALVIPGGQGLMVDLYYDSTIPRLLQSFAEHGKAIGLICHAPALVSTIPKEKNPFVGYTINSVTPFEELYIEKLIMKGKPKNRKIARQLKRIGIKYERGFPGKSYAVRDRNLVTSQNPYSGEEFNKLFLELLAEME